MKPKRNRPTLLAAARGSAIRDEFRGDNKHLKDCIKALISLNDDNALVPHGIGGHARNLLAACYHRLPNVQDQRQRPAEKAAAQQGNMMRRSHPPQAKGLAQRCLDT